MIQKIVMAMILAAGVSAHADLVRSMSHSQDSLTTFVNTIASAKKSLEMTTFIWEPCHTSTQIIMNELKAAARRGVRVRVLLDAFMLESEDIANLAADFARSRIEFRLYNQGIKFLVTTNPRTHVKLLVADGARYIAGGRNIADEYFGLGRKMNFVDQDLWVEGASARTARAEFDEMWTARVVSQPRAGVFKAWRQHCSKPAQKYLDETTVLNAFRDSPGTAVLRPVHECGDVGYHQDHPSFLDSTYGPDTGSDTQSTQPYMTEMRLRMKRSTKAYAEFVRGTRKRLEIVNWSYIPASVVNDAFQSLRARKIPVQILTNRDPEEKTIIGLAGDYMTSRYAARDNYGTQSVAQLSNKGSMNDRHPLTPNGTTFRIHAKMAVRDGRDVLVGSFNLDPRSAETNLEDVIVIRDCLPLANELRERVQDFRRFYVADVKSKVDPTPDQGVLAKVFAWLAFNFL